MRKQQRLVVCLDGTWNKKDDATNVLHHFALALKDEPPGVGPVTQTKYYDEGVGTGVLDGISGGGFGFGLEENVREAYNCLVEHYHDKDDQAKADEIYIFGFSRGAYTARSLVGFIGTCGLLRRGAPVSVNQLWSDYCILGRERERRATFWDSVFGKASAQIRRLNDLVVDPWKIERFEKKRAAKQSSAGDVEDRVPGQIVDDLNTAERLLVRWSRRVRITYLGVYDTVGAMGIDALAIPGLTSRLAMHHNMRATTLIQNCRHALAVDEHRSSFSHTPFLEYVGHGDEEDSHQRVAIREKDPSIYWRQVRAMWRRKIEQRWFVGAHSNIGGGYPNNELAQRPLAWLLEGAHRAGLKCESFSFVPPKVLSLPRDSYAEFAKPFWTQIIRGKRWYRPIDPEPEMRANRRKSADEDQPTAGFSLRTIHEQVDESVLDRFGGEYQPPNVVEYARRRKDEAAGAAKTARREANAAKLQGKTSRMEDQASKLEAFATKLSAIAAQKPMHAWIGGGKTAHFVLVFWATLTASGLTAVNELFSAYPGPSLPLWLLCVTACAFGLVDWGESRANFSLALGPASPRWRAFLDSIYWMRTVGFVLFVFGVVSALGQLWSKGWHADTWPDAWEQSKVIIKAWWLVPVAASLGVVMANLLDAAPARRQKAGLVAAILASVSAVAAIPLLVLLGGRVFGMVFTPMFGHVPLQTAAPAGDARLAGLVLLMQIAIVCFLNSFNWVGAPMSRANLDSIFWLQWRYTPEGVKQLLERWRKMLACRWNSSDQDATRGPAAHAMHTMLREALWRDIFGFIPIYFAVLTFGLWFATNHLGWDWLGRPYVSLPLWFLLPLIAAVADYVEDACHLRYLHFHGRGVAPQAILPPISFAMTLLKFAAYIPAMLLMLAALAERMLGGRDARQRHRLEGNLGALDLRGGSPGFSNSCAQRNPLSSIVSAASKETTRGVRTYAENRFRVAHWAAVFLIVVHESAD